MIKACSLEFINKNTFDVDIMLQDGRILFAAGSKITPEILLRLYYKEIYVEVPIVQEKQRVFEEIIEEEPTPIEEQPVEELSVENQEEFLEFDEQQAQRVSDYSVKLAQYIGMEQKQIQELQQAAYYHNIGRTRLTKANLAEKDFKKKQAEEGYKLLISEKKFSEKMAEAARLYNRRYQSSQTKFDDLKHVELPYSNIVAITNYYDELMSNNVTKEEALKKMLQLGGNKFNIFILHKFINMMRDDND